MQGAQEDQVARLADHLQIAQEEVDLALEVQDDIWILSEWLRQNSPNFGGLWRDYESGRMRVHVNFVERPEPRDRAKIAEFLAVEHVDIHEEAKHTVGDLDSAMAEIEEAVDELSRTGDVVGASEVGGV